MKKLMLGFAASAALVATSTYADGEVAPFANTIGFGAYTGTPTGGLSGKTDAGADEGNIYWLYTGSATDASTIESWAGTAPASSQIPDSFAETHDASYLKLKTDGGTLWRSLNTIDGSSLGARKDNSGKLYVDTLVQFTYSEDAPDVESTEANPNKLAIWWGSNGDASTNLYVTAGYVDMVDDVKTTTVKHYCITNITVSEGAWHRLTVKAIGDGIASQVDSSGGQVYQVYIDGVLCQAAVGTWSAEAIEDAGSDYSAKKWKTNSYFPSLFPSATLQAVGFQGQGAVDDLSIVETAPSFIPQETGLTFTITWDPEVVNIAASRNGSDIQDFSFEDGKRTWTKTDFALGDEVTFYLDGMSYSNGWESATWEYTGCDAEASEEETPIYTCTITGNGGSVTIKAQKVTYKEPTITVNGNVSQSSSEGTYTFTAASGYTPEVWVDGEKVVLTSGASSNVKTWTPTYTEAKNATVISRKVYDYTATAWYDSKKVFATTVLTGLPVDGNGTVSAFHGQGFDEFLALTFGTSSVGYRLYNLDTAEPTLVNQSPEAKPVSADGNFYTNVLRGVALSKIKNVALACSYSVKNPGERLLAFPLSGEIVLAGEGKNAFWIATDTGSVFDSASFSEDGKYLFSNENPEIDGSCICKWQVGNLGADGTGLTLVGKIDTGKRIRSMTYAKINGRDIVFAHMDAMNGIQWIDMTGDETDGWSQGLLFASPSSNKYGTMCVSGVAGGTPTLTVASALNGDNKDDFLNVYTLTVPDEGAVTATLAQSFTQTDLFKAGFGDLAKTVYGNTVYVTDDNKTIYFARGDGKLYKGEYHTGGTLLPEAETVADVKFGTAPTIAITGLAQDADWELDGALETALGTYTAYLKGKGDYFGWSKVSYTIKANDEAAVAVTLAKTEEEYIDSLPGYPAVSAVTAADVAVAAADYKAEWDKTLEAPEAGCTNTYTVTVTITNGNYNGASGTATYKLWKAAAASDPLPVIDNPTDQQAQEQIAKTAWTDATVATTITNAAEYTAFQQWSETVTGGSAAIVASEHAVESYALGVTTLLTESPEIEVTKVEADTAKAGNWNFDVEITGKTSTDAIDAAVASVKKLVKVGTSLSAMGAPADADVSVTESATGKYKVNVKPSTGATSYFFKLQK